MNVCTRRISLVGVNKALKIGRNSFLAGDALARNLIRAAPTRRFPFRSPRRRTAREHGVQLALDPAAEHIKDR